MNTGSNRGKTFTNNDQLYWYYITIHNQSYKLEKIREISN
jgi:hypothetical protein